ncbi:MAG: hypothetical protein KJ070_17625 [Verrucomicrobia bacterium]|nr:hypothetical protein [Verrucomicrobiota bacterium]
MSLKAFHVIFITAASALAFGFGVWMLREYRLPGGGSGDLAFGVASLIVGVALLVYEGYFLRKLKNESFL